MEIPQFSNNQFIDESLFNAAAAMVAQSFQDVGSYLHSAGLINAANLQITAVNNQLDVQAPGVGVVFSDGTLSKAVGIADNASSSTYNGIDFSSLIPSSGSVTAYLVATHVQIQQSPFTVVGPPVGHPAYDPNFQAYTAYAELQDSVALSATTTAPNNTTSIEICRVTLTAGQAAIGSVDTSHRVFAGSALAKSGVTPGEYTDATVTVDEEGRVTSAANGQPIIPSGETMFFVGSAAPTGWTQDTSVNDRVLRVVDSAGGGTGGSWTVSGITVDGHQLSTTEMPVHSHGVSDPGHYHTPYNSAYFDGPLGSGANFASGGDNGVSATSRTSSNPTGISIQNAGGGAAHSHGLTADGSWRPEYLDVIACQKN